MSISLSYLSRDFDLAKVSLFLSEEVALFS